MGTSLPNIAVFTFLQNKSFFAKKYIIFKQRKIFTAKINKSPTTRNYFLLKGFIIVCFIDLITTYAAIFFQTRGICLVKRNNFLSNKIILKKMNNFYHSTAAQSAAVVIMSRSQSIFLCIFLYLSYLVTSIWPLIDGKGHILVGSLKVTVRSQFQRNHADA